MNVSVKCPNCERSYDVSDAHLGRSARCKRCGRSFTLALPSGRHSRSKKNSLPKKIGPFDVRRKLGAGAMGDVFLAHDPLLDREIAIKVVKGELGDDESLRERFLREVRLAARLHHPNTVTIYSAGEAEGQLYVAMEYVNGRSLEQVVREEGPLPWPAATRAILEAAEGLAAAHALGIVHRDIKPANLLYTATGQTKVADFGLARELLASVQLTQQGMVVGTPAYMAPEQWANAAVDARADVYALTCTYFFLLTGERPFQGDSLHVLGYLHNTAPFPDPRQGGWPVPDAVCRILQRGSQKASHERYSSSEALAAALRQVLDTSSLSLEEANSWSSNGSLGGTTLPVCGSTPTLAPSIPPRKAAMGIRTLSTWVKTTHWPKKSVHVAVAAFAVVVVGIGLLFAMAGGGAGSRLGSEMESGNRLPDLAVAPSGDNSRTATIATEKEDSRLPVDRTPRPRFEPASPKDSDEDGGVWELSPFQPETTENEPRRQASSSDQGETPVRLESTINSIGMKLILIPQGKFTMGSPEEEANRSPDESLHEVNITRPYFMSEHEVTQSQFQSVMGYNPSDLSPTGAGHVHLGDIRDTAHFPVECVTWFDAVDFCNRLSQSERLPKYYDLDVSERRTNETIRFASVAVLGGNGYRLPTEAEWEYACRATTSTPFHFGSQLNGNEANVPGSFPYGTTLTGPDLQRITTVGSYSANAWGLFDMHGNVWEWCQDWYESDYYTRLVFDDPQGAEFGGSRVMRGGSWADKAPFCRSAARGKFGPSSFSRNIGFRVARNP